CLPIGACEVVVPFLDEPEQQRLAIRDLGPAPLGGVEDVVQVPGVGERVARLDRRHPLSVAPGYAGATPTKGTCELVVLDNREHPLRVDGGNVRAGGTRPRSALSRSGAAADELPGAGNPGRA